jgi:SAM-dependent methyltransferase
MLMPDGMSRRGLFTLGLERLRNADFESERPRPKRRPAPQPRDDADLFALSLAPAVTVAERCAPAPGEEVLIVRGGELEECFGDHDGGVAIAEPGELDETLPFDDASFDRVLAPLAPAYAEDARKAVAELFRVTRPGGTVVVATWTRERAVGRLLEAATGWEPSVQSRLDWGDEPVLQLALLDHAQDIRIERVELREPWSSPQAAAEAAERALPPVARALSAYPGADANALRAHAVRLIAEEGEGEVTGAWLLAVAKRRSG